VAANHVEARRSFASRRLADCSLFGVVSLTTATSLSLSTSGVLSRLCTGSLYGDGEPNKAYASRFFSSATSYFWGVGDFDDYEGKSYCAATLGEGENFYGVVCL